MQISCFPYLPGFFFHISTASQGEKGPSPRCPTPKRRVVRSKLPLNQFCCQSTLLHTALEELAPVLSMFDQNCQSISLRTASWKAAIGRFNLRPDVVSWYHHGLHVELTALVVFCLRPKPWLISNGPLWCINRAVCAPLMVAVCPDFVGFITLVTFTKTFTTYTSITKTIITNQTLRYLNLSPAPILFQWC
jgi:hypothetical protein